MEFSSANLINVIDELELYIKWIECIRLLCSWYCSLVCSASNTCPLFSPLSGRIHFTLIRLPIHLSQKCWLFVLVPNFHDLFEVFIWNAEILMLHIIHFVILDFMHFKRRLFRERSANAHWTWNMIISENYCNCIYIQYSYRESVCDRQLLFGWQLIGYSIQKGWDEKGGGGPKRSRDRNRPSVHTTYSSINRDRYKPKMSVVNEFKSVYCMSQWFHSQSNSSIETKINEHMYK